MELIPEGEYMAKAGSASLRETSTGKEYVNVSFTITDGPFKGKIVSEDLYLTDAAWEFTVKKLRACGWGDNIEDLATVSGDVKVKLEHEADKNKDGTQKTTKTGQPLFRVRVKYIDPMRGTPLAKEKTQSLAQRMRANLADLNRREAEKNGGAPPATAPPAARAPAASPANGNQASRPPVAVEEDDPF